MSGAPRSTKKERILAAARALGRTRCTLDDMKEIQRRLLAEHGAAGRATLDHIEGVLKGDGWEVIWASAAEADLPVAAELADVLHFSGLEEAEACIRRLNDLWWKYASRGEPGAANLVLDAARRGRRRAEMIAGNARVAPAKREEKRELAEWFRIWLEMPETFFDWLALRKQAPEFRERFGGATQQPGEAAPQEDDGTNGE
jgi:hypothetical protein